MNSRLERCRWPLLDKRYDLALREAIDFILEQYPQTIGIVASGTIIRGNPSASSDLDLYVVQTAPFRQRVQKFFNGVPAEIFVNPPNAIEQYFAQENRSGRPMTAHMLATGFVVFDSSQMVEDLREKARDWLKQAPQFGDLTMMRYSIASGFEDATDVAATDPTTARMLLSEVMFMTLQCVFLKANRHIPRFKELLSETAKLDLELGRLAQEFYGSASFEQQLSAAEAIIDKVVGSRGFFEWESESQAV